MTSTEPVASFEGSTPMALATVPNKVGYVRLCRLATKAGSMKPERRQRECDPEHDAT